MNQKCIYNFIEYLKSFWEINFSVPAPSLLYSHYIRDQFIFHTVIVLPYVLCYQRIYINTKECLEKFS